MKLVTTSPKRKTLLGAALVLGLSSLALTGCGSSDDHQSSTGTGGGGGGGTTTTQYILTDLSTSGETRSFAYGINASGTVAGTAFGSSNHAFVSGGGTSTDLGVHIGFAWSFASGINAAGDVVGSLAQSSGLDSHAFVYSGGK